MAVPGLADVLVDYPRKWSGRLRAADTVSSFAPDLAILLPNSLESALAAWYWGARRRVGFAAGGRSALLTDAVPVPSPRRHQIDEYLMLLEQVAASAAPRIGVHLGAAYGPAKLWPLERVVDLCRLLAADRTMAILLGAPGDAGSAATITAQAPAVSLVGRDRPALLPALLSELDVLVSGDTGVAHLSAAVGTPVVTLFGPSAPRLSAPRGRVAVVTHPVPCAPCFYRICPIEHPCLRNISAADVYAHAREVMALRAAAAGEASL